MQMVFRAMGTQSIVIEGAQPSPYALSSEREAYTTMSQSAFLVLIQVLSKPILKKVAKYQTPYEIWSYLKQTYHVDNAFSFIHQMHALFGLSQTFPTTEPVSDFLDRFEAEWERLYQLTGSSSSNSYRKTLRQFIDHDEAKRDFLLASLIKHPVDTLQLKKI